MQKAVVLAGGTLALVALAGCASEEPSEVAPSSFVGSSVGQLEDALPGGTVYVSYDVSLPVAGKEARYGMPGSGTNRDWIVVVACGTSTRLAVGVVNGQDYTLGVAESAREGKFDTLLPECKTD